jgi:hypothetical protein
MKISGQTVKYLQNFTTINQGIVIKAGNVLRTMNAEGNLFAEAEIAEQFEREFGVYDLKKLLALLSLAKEPDVQVDETTIKVKGGKSTVSMRHTNTKLIISPPNKKIVAQYFVTFDLSVDDLKWIFNTSSILGTNEVIVAGKDGKLFIQAIDVSGKVVDEGALELGATEHNFKAVMKVERMKLMAGDYEVSVSRQGVVQFANKNTNLKYWVALENEPSEFN